MVQLVRSAGRDPPGIPWCLDASHATRWPQDVAGDLLWDVGHGDIRGPAAGGLRARLRRPGRTRGSGASRQVARRPAVLTN